MNDLLFIRVVFVLLSGALAVLNEPFGFSGVGAAGIGAAAGLACVAIEWRLRQLTPRGALGAAIGALLGLTAAALASFILVSAADRSGTTIYLHAAAMALGVYLGGTLGSSKGYGLPVAGEGTGAAEAGGPGDLKILDTSVIIDGRIADIAETGFLGGTLAIPQFVLRELQLVADSADSMKRNRGRRGLDILQRIQKMPQLKIKILENDFPQVREVDMKLIELAKVIQGKIVTNDFNLNKVAQLHGVQVLNINELANALKPIVLPGEIMRVFVLKEGKEYNQGVAYLDDGTMVVVDNARRLISKTIDISVTSVLQTTAGKMIFGRFDERAHAVYDKSVPDRPQREQSSAAAPHAS